MQRAVGVPQGIGAVGSAALGDGVDLPVHAGIAPIDVRKQRRRELGVVERGGEDRPLIGRAAFHANRIERRLPPGGGFTTGAVEVPMSRLGDQIGAGTGEIDARNAATYGNRGFSGIFIVQHGLESPSGDLPTAGRLGGIVIGIERDPIGLARELEREKDLAALGPAEDLSLAGDRAVGPHLDRRVGDQRRAVRAVEYQVREIEQDMPRAGRKRVAMPAGPLGHGQFGADAVFERHAVIAGLGALVLVALAIAGLRLFAGAGLQRHRSPPGDDEQIEHVADARA